eukprot:228026-Chlamydomonas_euryale.AAC.1
MGAVRWRHGGGEVGDGGIAARGYDRRVQSRPSMRAYAHVARVCMRAYARVCACVHACVHVCVCARKVGVAR